MKPLHTSLINFGEILWYLLGRIRTHQDSVVTAADEDCDDDDDGNGKDEDGDYEENMRESVIRVLRSEGAPAGRRTGCVTRHRRHRRRRHRRRRRRRRRGGGGGGGEEGGPRRDALALRDVVVVVVDDGTIAIATETARNIRPRPRRGGEDDDAIVWLPVGGKFMFCSFLIRISIFPGSWPPQVTRTQDQILRLDLPYRPGDKNHRGIRTRH
jgi:hypothetical protein